MENEAMSGKNADLANERNMDKGISGPNEKLQQSYKTLVTLMSTLTPEQRGDFIELLKILVEECAPRKSTSEAIRQELERRISDRRQGERRQNEACQGRQQDEKRQEERRQDERRQGERRQFWITNSHTPWTAKHIYMLEDMANQNLSAKQIALKLGRTSRAIEAKAKELGISLSETE